MKHLPEITLDPKVHFKLGEASIIISIACRVCRISEEEFVSNSRDRPISDSRKIAAKVINELLPTLRLRSQTPLFNRDHSTIITMRETAMDLSKVDDQFNRLLSEVRDRSKDTLCII